MFSLSYFLGILLAYLLFWNCFPLLVHIYQHFKTRRWRSGLERWPRKRRVDSSNPNCIPVALRSLKVARATFLYMQKIFDLLRRVLRDDNYKQCHSKCATQKMSHCSMAMITEHRLTFAAVRLQWLFLHEWNMSEIFVNTQTNPKFCLSGYKAFALFFDSAIKISIWHWTFILFFTTNWLQK